MINQTNTYYERMDASLGDKAKLLPHIPEDAKVIVDVGGGDGSFLNLLRPSFPHARLINVEAAEESYQRSVANGVDTKHGRAEQLDDLFEEHSVDVVIASSLVHEVFSYPSPICSYGEACKGGHMEHVTSFLDAVHLILKPGGTLIIRDGVSPRLSRNAIVEYTGTAIEEGYAHFYDESPFMIRDAILDSNYEAAYPDRHFAEHVGVPDEQGGFLPLRFFSRYGHHYMTGSLITIYEFLLTYTWGKEPFEREVQERYGLLPANPELAWAWFPEYELIHTESYVQPGYPEHLPDVRFVNVDFPATNGIWVLRA